MNEPQRRSTLNLAILVSLFNLLLIGVTHACVGLEILPEQAMAWTMFGVAGLIALWLAFGGLRAPWRQFICTALMATLAYLGSANRIQVAIKTFMLIFSLMGYWYLLLLPLRHFAGLQWGMVDDAPLPRASRSHFSIRHILAYMLLTAVPLACSQWLYLRDDSYLVSGLIIGAILGATMIGAMLPFMLALFSNDNPLKRTAIALIWGIFFATVIYMLPFSRYRPIALQGLGCLPVIAINLLVLRQLGVRWRTFERPSIA
jgi:hypothetical protein